MTAALLVIDVQEGILNQRNFEKELVLIEAVMNEFQTQKQPIFAAQHVDDSEKSPLYKDSSGVNIWPPVVKQADFIFQKQTPSVFKGTDIHTLLQDQQINHLFIVGFNTEFCCLFSAITAFERGYQVTFIEDATGTVNSCQTYEMPGLDIRDFIGTVLHWSECIEVLDYEEYEEKYKISLNK